jgi:hypothetical protein
LLSVGTAKAVSIVCTPPNGNCPQPNEENILLANGQSALIVQGTTNQSGTVFDFTGDETLITQASGQAKINAADGDFTFLSITPDIVGTTFKDLILNVDLAGTGQQSGSLVFLVQLLGGPLVQIDGPQALGQGQNFFTILAGPNEQIVRVDLVETGADEIKEVRQIRISGICVGEDCFQTRVPEPGTLALLGGSLLGLVGFASRRRRNRR